MITISHDRQQNKQDPLATRPTERPENRALKAKPDHRIAIQDSSPQLTPSDPRNIGCHRTPDM
jgi:hypothetical protein